MLDETEESGWKNIHGEVFRFPPNKNLFCAFVGSGFQVSSQLPPTSPGSHNNVMPYGADAHATCLLKLPL